MPLDVMPILDGTSKTATARVLRVVTATVEPAYVAVMLLRNTAYDRGLKKAHDLGRATISIGNITTGGTGKTPVVRWLANRLRDAGERPAVLMRGYRATETGSDEQRELDRALNGNNVNYIPVHANPSRVDGAAAVLAAHPEVTIFLLDDAFQHRKAKRDFDLVLINATAPFGFGHVLPRGLLREPLAGLKRAHAVLITHQGQVLPTSLDALITEVRQYTPAPVFRCDHVLSGLWQPTSGEVRHMSSLAAGSPFAIAGIGDPSAFGRSLESYASGPLPHRWFADHHAYTAKDWADVCTAAEQAGCDRIVTTEKDWSKLLTIVTPRMAVEVVQLSIEFVGEDGEKLFALIRASGGTLL